MRTTIASNKTRSNQTRSNQTIDEYRVRASRLLKELRLGDAAAALSAGRRLQSVPAWAAATPEEIVAARDAVRRKHALAAVAAEAGFRDWADLKARCEAAPTGHFDTTLLFRGAAFLNHWCKTYGEAREVLLARPGTFLFPYREHYVVCEAALLEARGVDASDPDWERIERDWVRPLDGKAWSRLCVRLRRATG